MWKALAIMAFLAFCQLALCANGMAGRPFLLPVAAKSVERSRDGKGWLESGFISVPFVQAEASFKSALAQSGWRYLHAVALSPGNSNTLYTWRRGDMELTLMLCRVGVCRTNFSWGLANSENTRKENHR